MRLGVRSSWRLGLRSKLPLCAVYVGPEQYVGNKAEQLDHFDRCLP
jgi:hypothetical protein